MCVPTDGGVCVTGWGWGIVRTDGGVCVIDDAFVCVCERDMMPLCVCVCVCTDSGVCVRHDTFVCVCPQMVVFVGETMPLCVCVQTVVFMGDMVSLRVCVSTDGGVCGLVLRISSYGTQG